MRDSLQRPVDTERRRSEARQVVRDVMDLARADHQRRDPQSDDDKWSNGDQRVERERRCMEKHIVSASDADGAPDAPNDQGAGLLALAAYSHSASVGRR